MLDKTLQAYRKLKQPINYTSALTHRLSKNVGKKAGATSEHKGPPGVSKPDVQWCVDPFSASAMDGLQKSSGTYHTELLPGGTSSACSTQSLHRNSLYDSDSPTPASTSQVAIFRPLLLSLHQVAHH